MVRQEQSEVKGGILADEMGMGKTIQTIALMLSRTVQGPTLVVCPVSSMMQWEAEIKEHVVPGTLSIVVVYKTTKITKQMLEDADVVLTTYPMVEQAWRTLIHKIKVPCPYCDQLFIPRQLVVHNKYYCGPKAKKTQKQMKREKAKQTNHRVQSKQTIRKGLKTLHVELEEDDEEESEKEEGNVKGKGVVGPIGMYQELMREAGRTVRSRWDPSKKNSSESDESSEEESEEESDDDSDGDDEGEEEEEEQENELMTSFRCDQCGFQLLRFPFCPKTGQHHVLAEEQKKIIDNDTGGDNVDLSQSIFHSIRWARIILDEAHRIKGRTTNTARSAFALEAEYRWCLTGTPLQNRVGDVYSLLRFLRISPFSNYYCLTDGCSCCSLSHPFSGTNLRQCVFCGHGPVQHYAYFNRYILNPINRYGYIGDGRRGMMMLANEVFSKSMLRRTKVERAADLHLPPLNISTHKIHLTPEELNFYESLYKKTTAQFDTFVSKGTVLHNYAHIFQLLSRLRQALDHPLLVMQNMNVGVVRHQEGVCGICGEGLEGESFIKTSPCRHKFHRLCLSQFLESAPDKDYHCPTCYVKINVDLRQLRTDVDDDDDAGVAAMPPEMEEQEEEEEEEQEAPVAEEAPTHKAGSEVAQRWRRQCNGKKPPILSRLDPTQTLHGTKLNAISNYIAATPAEDKVIVFSQFGDMLDLTQYWLQRRFIKSVKLCGSLTLTQRLAVLQAFLHDPKVKVILISLKAGGEGLNLQVANHVILIDPWWNPAVEMQAIQRAHRIGQQKPVHAVRFVTDGTVEERMVDLQDKKMLVFEGTIDGKMQSLNKLSSEDLQFLFTR
ncbi:DNA repair protein RAD16 [Angomonas deanei]|uniref:SNF2 family N-terminal domain/Ring finger domain/Zinc finger, C3HC4 type (RING finger)/Helicase conserved C-terminal domain containing protein, putative n=1 Tax=Angomonas deanei TaxID=59799 RepID=A0A7G2CCG5_9TRYP|nr:DNA repair protein RAD16 [Angomonas deanei]CAD2217209.1 SNF2 family N-terminal domain/Ring finger domain/Zinc finger, C3HC4 type (RING finger)/Helicase conserved C-terminal domain containing protein, putative [Angomonas deanei]|eukprot:EPY24036.1 DNA repair protein RAD16 [Angomonas deanei]